MDGTFDTGDNGNAPPWPSRFSIDLRLFRLHIVILASAEAAMATVDEGFCIAVVLGKERVRSEKYVL